jgi:hypothetical protein
MIKPKILLKDLHALEKLLTARNIKLVVPPNQIHQYYTLPIARCHITKTEIQVAIRIMTNYKPQKYAIYEPIPIGFQFNLELCHLKIDKALLIKNEDNKQEYIISGRELESCNFVDRTCNIGATIYNKNAACIQKLFNKRTKAKINNVCHFECTKHEQGQTLPKIYDISYRQYVISNLSKNTRIVYANGTTEYIAQADEETTGALFAKILCNAQLVDQLGKIDQILINVQIPCFSDESLDYATINRIIPVQWTNLPQGFFSHGFATPHEFDDNASLVNDKWKLDTPTVQIRTQLEIEQELERV